MISSKSKKSLELVKNSGIVSGAESISPSRTNLNMIRGRPFESPTNSYRQNHTQMIQVQDQMEVIPEIIASKSPLPPIKTSILGVQALQRQNFSTLINQRYQSSRNLKPRYHSREPIGSQMQLDSDTYQYEIENMNFSVDIERLRGLNTGINSVFSPAKNKYSSPRHNLQIVGNPKAFSSIEIESQGSQVNDPSNVPRRSPSTRLLPHIALKRSKHKSQINQGEHKSVREDNREFHPSQTKKWKRNHPPQNIGEIKRLQVSPYQLKTKLNEMTPKQQQLIRIPNADLERIEGKRSSITDKPRSKQR